jgi:hypothetical protein
MGSSASQPGARPVEIASEEGVCGLTQKIGDNPQLLNRRQETRPERPEIVGWFHAAVNAAFETYGP